MSGISYHALTFTEHPTTLNNSKQKYFYLFSSTSQLQTSENITLVTNHSITQSQQHFTLSCITQSHQLTSHPALDPHHSTRCQQHFSYIISIEPIHTPHMLHISPGLGNRSFWKRANRSFFC